MKDIRFGMENIRINQKISADVAEVLSVRVIFASVVKSISYPMTDYIHQIEQWFLKGRNVRTKFKKMNLVQLSHKIKKFIGGTMTQNDYNAGSQITSQGIEDYLKKLANSALKGEQGIVLTYKEFVHLSIELQKSKEREKILVEALEDLSRAFSMMGNQSISDALHEVQDIANEALEKVKEKE